MGQQSMTQRRALFPVRCALCRVNDLMSGVDVVKSTVAHIAGLGNVFCVSEVVVGCPEEFVGLAETIVRAEVGVDGEGIIEALAVVDRGALDLVDGGINLADGGVVVAANGIPRPVVAEVVTSCAEVAKGVEIGGVWAGNLLRVKCCKWGGEEAQCNEQGADFCHLLVSDEFHGHGARMSHAVVHEDERQVALSKGIRRTPFVGIDNAGESRL
jgi:hypothetical protein